MSTMRSLSVLSLTLSLLALPATGCFNPQFGEGGFGCKPTDGDKACPPGYTCQAEGSSYVCRHPSTTDAAIDQAVPDQTADKTVPDVLAPDVLAPDVLPPDVLAPDVLAPDVFGPDLCNPIDLPDDAFTDSNCDGVDGDAADSIFVDPINGSDTGDGTRAKPLQHLTGTAGAIALAQTKNKHHILVSTGTLSESETVDVPNGISLWGGYDAAQGWARSDTITRPRVAVTAPTAVRVSSPAIAMRWDRIDVTAGNAVTPGESSYGMVVTNGNTFFTLSNASVAAGKGAAGAASQTPSKQPTPPTANGGVGGGERVATCCVATISNSCAPGVAGQNTCAFAGGAGNPCGSPGAPVPGTGPNPGAGGSGNAPGGPGGPGAPGAAATAPTVAFGTVGMSGYVPAKGTIGGPGAGGSGGGGGGYNGPSGCTCNTIVTTKPGHGGGAGGCGGQPASAAGGGGGSFALFLFDASPTLDNVNLVASQGGNGGDGAIGGPGMDGGLGGGLGTNVAGGAGGKGGPGAPSSGGPGGPSICLERAGTSTPTISTNVTYVQGTAGLGGSSPDATLKGIVGVVATQRTN